MVTILKENDRQDLHNYIHIPLLEKIQNEEIANHYKNSLQITSRRKLKKLRSNQRTIYSNIRSCIPSIQIQIIERTKFMQEAHRLKIVILRPIQRR